MKLSYVSLFILRSSLIPLKIGAHTFLLKEIYGLSSTSTQAQQPTYPPPAGMEADPYASTPNECIVCLTAPRDVVLLPCRHLVVCRDCAVGMVEFGAGGKVGRRDDATGAATGGEEAANATGMVAESTPLPPVAGGTTATGRERRKKKAKGWYCPVCRQRELRIFRFLHVDIPLKNLKAYTSLLRLALPASAKPQHAHPSRPPSIRSVRSTRSLRRAPSIAPTLPDGAEEMLDNLRLNKDAVDDFELQHEAVNAVPFQERPQFVLGPDVDDEESQVKQEWSSEAERVAASHGAADVSNKGWKEVA